LSARVNAIRKSPTEKASFAFTRKL
jgi:hypothetical protein